MLRKQGEYCVGISKQVFCSQGVHTDRIVTSWEEALPLSQHAIVLLLSTEIFPTDELSTFCVFKKSEIIK